MARAFAAASAAADVACLLLRPAPGFADAAIRSAVAHLRAAVQGRELAILLEDRVDLVTSAAADGVHLGLPVAYDEARRRLGPELIVGVSCGTRDEAIAVAEHGADYVAFGEFDDPSPRPAALELMEWWAEIMTVPCVGTGCGSARDAARLAAAGADFVASAREPGTFSRTSRPRSAVPPCRGGRRPPLQLCDHGHWTTVGFRYIKTLLYSYKL